MKNLSFRTLSKAVNYYSEQGYSFPFNFSATPTDPANWNIVMIHRFEGFSDPSDNMILFILENSNGLDKGIILDAYGAERNEAINQFLQNMPRQFPVWLIAREEHLPEMPKERSPSSVF